MKASPAALKIAIERFASTGVGSVKKLPGI
jgi:hypothetical protein